ncbi:hypothetical protein GR210_06960 [Rhizobium leguminosarum]|nr:hypothetical protein [Rhizobium leguminosarum]NEH48541.1 hypothetical protein [Rhizobium leguminosarum]
MVGSAESHPGDTAEIQDRDGASIVLEAISQTLAVAQSCIEKIANLTLQIAKQTDKAKVFEVLPSRRKMLCLLNSFQSRLLACLADVLIILNYY